MKPLLISSGEPAGIGPDLCLALAAHNLPIVVMGDQSMLATRADDLGLDINFIEYRPGIPLVGKSPCLHLIPIHCTAPVIPGVLNPDNAAYVLDMLTQGVQRCLQGEFSALVTAPVHKAVINQAGYAFTGHTEFFADYCQVHTVVMMLACPAMRVALVTTHLPLREVADTITKKLLTAVIQCLNASLKQDFGIENPMIHVAGLNPHAGESGYLGREEIDIIGPALVDLKQQGLDVHGPLPADTLFTPQFINTTDAFVAMYHDQGLPVLKYAGFGQAVNITLGLPIIRTSVDHGTALDLAAKGLADTGSMLAAVEMALLMVNKREQQNDHH